MNTNLLTYTEIETIDRHVQTIMDGNMLTENDIRELCDKAKEILSEESNVHPVKAPVTICGDIHG